MVVAVAPGNTAEEMIEQVTKPLENYIFSYKEVKERKNILYQPGWNRIYTSRTK